MIGNMSFFLSCGPDSTRYLPALIKLSFLCDRFQTSKRFTDSDLESWVSRSDFTDDEKSYFKLRKTKTKPIAEFSILSF